MTLRADRVGLILAVVAWTVIACTGNPGASASSTAKLAVVTTSTVFGDLIANVGGDQVTVTSLVPKNGDVHTFSPSPTDVRAVSGAKLIVMNGLGLDDWLRETIKNAAAPGTPVVELGTSLPGVSILPGEEPGTQNPHLWMSVPYASGYVDEISQALATADPTNANAYRDRATTYKTTLQALDKRTRDRFAAIPKENLKIVTFHDAFPYFAREYGLEVVGVAVEAPGQDPSAAETAALITAIRQAGVKAIFSEAQFPTRLVDQIASETGAHVVANLYDDSLGDPPVTSYEALIDWDVDQIATALK